MLVLLATGHQAAARLRSLAGSLDEPAAEISAHLFEEVDEVLLDRLTIRPPAGPQPAGSVEDAEGGAADTGNPITLTERETRILALVASGRSNRLISRDLFVSESTVKAHLTHLYTTLAVDNRTAAVHAARRLGLLPD